MLIFPSVYSVFSVSNAKSYNFATYLFQRTVSATYAVIHATQVRCGPEGVPRHTSTERHSASEPKEPIQRTLQVVILLLLN